MASHVLTNRTFFEALLESGLKPFQDDFKEGAKKYLMKYLNRVRIGLNTTMETYVDTFTTTVERHWRTYDRRKNRMFTKHKIFYGKFVDFEDKEEDTVEGNN